MTLDPDVGLGFSLGCGQLWPVLDLEPTTSRPRVRVSIRMGFAMKMEKKKICRERDIEKEDEK